VGVSSLFTGVARAGAERNFGSETVNMHFLTAYSATLVESYPKGHSTQERRIDVGDIELLGLPCPEMENWLTDVLLPGTTPEGT
jgi:hypothetical protein